MWRSLFLKEWLKLRWFFAALILLNVGLCVKIYLDIRTLLTVEHAEMVWYQAIHLHTVFHHDMRYMPLLTGLALAAAQFVPEIMGRRLRIALHLPIARDAMILVCLLAGLGHVLVVCVLDAALIYLTLYINFPGEVALAALVTAIPWFLAGIGAYLGGVVVLLETAWPRRLFLLFVFSVLVSVMFSGRGYGWLDPALPWLVGLMVPAFLSVFESARRFQRRGA